MTTILGVDPGLSGALALLSGDSLVIHDMPTLTPGKRRVIDEIELARIIDAAGPIDHAFVEDVGVRQGEGVLGAFSFGLGCGIIRGILRAHFIRLEFISPVRWKRAMGIKAGSGKDASRALAKSMWQPHAGLFNRVKDDGRAEAALIAAYGARTLVREAA